MLITGLLALAVLVGVGIVVLVWETERLREERARNQAILSELRFVESRLSEKQMTPREQRQLREWWG